MKHRPALSVASFALALLVAALGVSCATAGKDPYFMKTATKANVFVAPVPAPISKIAIMPFRAQTELVGSSVSDMFVTEMLRARRYELVERGQMTQVLSESELILAGLSATKATEVGAMLGADGVVIGTVDEYSTVARRGRTYPVVGISVRLIDVESGKVMWSADLAKTTEEKNVTLPEHVRVVVHELMAALYQNWGVQKMVGRAPRVPEKAGKRSDDAVGMKTSSAPPEPPEFTLSDMGMREVTVTWTDVPRNASEFRIERSESMDGPFKEAATVSAAKKSHTDAGSRSAGLKDATTYYYRLCSISSDGAKSTPSAVRESMTAPPPDPPRNVRAEAHTSRGVKLAWDPSGSEAVVSYAIERAEGSGGMFTEIGNSKTFCFVDGGAAGTTLKDNTTYGYRVSAINRVAARGPASAPVSVKTLAPPAAVVGVTARSGEVRCVPLSWSPSDQPDIIRYDIYRQCEGETEFKFLTSIQGRDRTAHLDGGSDPGNLADQATYVYKVRAVNAVGSEGRESAAARATTREPPPAVSGLAAESDRPREVPLSWQVSPDEKVIGYEIRREDAGGVFVSIGRVTGADATSFTDRGTSKRASGLGVLRDGTEYRYQVLAFNTADALSPEGETAQATTKPVPDTPISVSTTEDLPRSIRVSWIRNSEPDIERYVVEASKSRDGRFHELARVPAGEQSFTEEKLGDGEGRCYRIKAIDADTLESEWSEIAAGVTKPLPDAPAGVQAEAAADGFRVWWSAPPQVDVTSYKVWKKGFVGSELLETVSGNECTLSALTVGKRIAVQVSAVDDDGLESEKSPAVEITGTAPR